MCFPFTCLIPFMSLACFNPNHALVNIFILVSSFLLFTWLSFFPDLIFFHTCLEIMNCMSILHDTPVILDVSSLNLINTFILLLNNTTIFRILYSDIIPLFLIFFFFTFIYFWETERDSTSKGGAEKEWDTESKADSRLWAVSTEPDVGLKPTNHEIMTWAESWLLTGHLNRTLNQLSHPGTPILSSFLKNSFSENTILGWLLFSPKTLKLLSAKYREQTEGGWWWWGGEGWRGKGGKMGDGH